MSVKAMYISIHATKIAIVKNKPTINKSPMAMNSEVLNKSFILKLNVIKPMFPTKIRIKLTTITNKPTKKNNVCPPRIANISKVKAPIITSANPHAYPDSISLDAVMN